MKNITVGTFNIQGWLMDGMHSWTKRADLNAETLVKQKLDIIGFQEFHKDNLDIYLKKLDYFAWHFGFDEGNGIVQNPITWNKYRFKNINQGSFWVSENGTMSKSWEAAAPRSCSWVLLDDLETGKTFLHANVHLDQVSEIARIEEVKLILMFINQQTFHWPIIITGDYNCSPYNPNDIGQYTDMPYQLMKQAGFKHAWEETHKDWPATYHASIHLINTGHGILTAYTQKL